jgi:hypothetical protein
MDLDDGGPVEVGEGEEGPDPDHHAGKNGEASSTEDEGEHESGNEGLGDDEVGGGGGGQGQVVLPLRPLEDEGGGDVQEEECEDLFEELHGFSMASQVRNRWGFAGYVGYKLIILLHSFRATFTPCPRFPVPASG